MGLDSRDYYQEPARSMASVVLHRLVLQKPD